MPTSVLPLLVAALAAAFSFLAVASGADAGGRQVIVEIRALTFDPVAPRVEPGDVVIWINRDIVPHTVTAHDGSWDSGTLETDAQWQMTITDGLSMAYYCRFHPTMVADLIVQTD